MNADIIRKETPEERELNKKRAELAKLEADLTQHELDLATLQAEMHDFESRYLRIVGTCYAQLDEIDARIAEALAKLNPNNRKSQEQAANARAQAQESAGTAEAVQEQLQRNGFKPSEKLKKLYRDIAKRVHPDLSTNEKERTLRHAIMAEVNHAYERGDNIRLEAILREWEISPESIEGEGIGSELIRIIRKIAQIEERLRIIEIEIAQLKESDLYHLKIRFDTAEQEGRDLFAEMVAQINQQITETNRQIADISKRLAEIIEKRVVV
jgi:multidrug efflux pump subunit AcrA (membrane-fusion protein)